MHVINHKQHRSSKRGHNKRRLVIGASVALGIFIVANLGMLIAYHNRALPNYQVGSMGIGGKSFTEIDKMLMSQTLPETITITKGPQSQKITVRDLGIMVDKTATTKAVKNRPFVPLLSLMMHHTVPLVLHSDTAKATQALTAYDATFSKAPTDKHVVFKDNTFTTEDAAAGYGFDEETTARQAFKAIADGKTTVEAATKSLPKGNNDINLTSQVSTLQKQLQTKVSFTIGSQKVQASTGDVGSWYTAEGNTMVVSDNATGTYLDKLGAKYGVTVANRSDLLTAIKYVLGKNLATNLRISAAGSSTIRTYCTAANGVPESELGDLIGKLAATYSDVRGWNDSGKIAFKHVDSGCDYRVVIAAPSLMTSYGAICDDYYNCQVGNNVIVNSDRWTTATDPWNKTGQNLETYRLLIINHETGHRLGFRDYNVCSGPGQPAPVMMQQSIDLMGCVFNVWPLQSELDKL